jgi:hypothetical protein
MPNANIGTTGIVNEWASFEKTVDGNSAACAGFRQKRERTLEPNATISGWVR